MRILAIKRRLPRSTRSGQNLPVRELLARLAQRHNVLLACWEDEAGTDDLNQFQTLLQPLPKAPSSPAGAILDLAFARHYGFAPATVPWLRQLIDEWCPDVVYGLDYQTLLPLDANPQCPRVCALVDNRHLVARQRWQQARQRPRLLAELTWSYLLHRRFAHAAEAFTFVSEREAAGLRRFTDRSCVAIPNGVDTDYFSPAATPRDDTRVVFVGSLDFPPNIDAVRWFCRSVWPLVREAEPAAQLSVVGKSPVAQVLTWHGRDGISVVADAPDVRPYLAGAAVAVVPMRSGGGIKNKILEAWAMATPTVATTMSLHGTAARPDENIMVADAPEEFAAAVVRCLLDRAWRAQLGAAGRETAVNDHSWECAADRLEHCLAAAVAAANTHEHALIA